MLRVYVHDIGLFGRFPLWLQARLGFPVHFCFGTTSSNVYVTIWTSA